MQYYGFFSSFSYAAIQRSHYIIYRCISTSVKLMKPFYIGLISEKYVNNWTIVGIPLLLKAIILGVQIVLEVLLEDIGIHKRESIVQHNVITLSSFLLYVVIHYLITLSILAFQLPPNSMTVSQSLCHFLHRM